MIRKSYILKIFIYSLILLISGDILSISRKSSSNAFPKLLDTRKELEKKLSDTFDAGIESGLIIGSYTVMQKNGETILEISEKSSADTLVPMASISKPFTALAIMKLVDMGFLDWNDRVTDHLPAFKKYGHNGNPILIRHLLTHTSGIPYSGSNSHYKFSVNNKKFRLPKQNFTTGAKFQYSNFNYRLLGAIIESAYENTFAESMKELILEPLGIEKYKLDYADGGAGLYLAPEELLRFAEFFLQGGMSDDEQVLSQSLIRKMFKPGKKQKDYKYYYGFGWRVDRGKGYIENFYHNGIGDYARNHLKIYPKEKIVLFYTFSHGKVSESEIERFVVNWEKILQNYRFNEASILKLEEKKL